MTAWDSYPFDDIHAMVRSVDASTLRGIAQRWQRMAHLIDDSAHRLAVATDDLHGSWTSPTAAGLFQQTVTESVSRMQQWRSAAGGGGFAGFEGRAGSLTEAATAVQNSQQHLEALRRRRQAELDAVQAATLSDTERQAKIKQIQDMYDKLARAEGRLIGGALVTMTPWTTPAGYTGLLGLRPGGNRPDPSEPPGQVEPRDATTADPVTVLGPDDRLDPADPMSDESPVSPELNGGVPVVPVGTVGAPVFVPPLVGLPLPGSATIPTGPPALPAGVSGLAGGTAGGTGGGVRGSGYSAGGLYGRLAGQAGLPGALQAGTAPPASSQLPIVPPAGSPAAGVAGRRSRPRRTVVVIMGPLTGVEQEETSGPAVMTGRLAERTANPVPTAQLSAHLASPTAPGAVSGL